MFIRSVSCHFYNEYSHLGLRKYATPITDEKAVHWPLEQPFKNKQILKLQNSDFPRYFFLSFLSSKKFPLPGRIFDCLNVCENCLKYFKLEGISGERFQKRLILSF